MMHKKNLVVAIKVGGHVLRETSERVELPFGSEYSIMLKNLDSVRQQVQISIDGEQATGWLVIDPNSRIEVERFIKGNLERGNRFKFIERTEAVEKHRGIQAEDGLVRIEFRREKVYVAPTVTHTYHYDHHYNHEHYPYCPREHNYPWQFICNSQSGTSSSVLPNNGTITRGMRSGTGASGISGQSVHSANTMSFSGPISAPQNDAGITVPGSLSDQRFILVMGFDTEPSEVITLHLVGYTGKVPVRVVKTVDQKPTCDTCGKTNKVANKFCSQCGTSLERV